MSDLFEVRFTPLEEFAAVDEPGADALAIYNGDPDQVVIAAGSDSIVYGDGGAGKTTLTLDLCFKLAAGDAWLDLIEPERPLAIGIIENEGPRPMLRRKLARKLKATGAKLDQRISVLDEPWGEITLADETHRRSLAMALFELELDILVIGPLISAGEFPNGGTPTEVKQFETHVNALRALVERPLSILVVHHENRAGQISGAWGRFGDLHIHVTAQGNGRTMLQWKKVRWASTLHKTQTQLVWAAGESFTVEENTEHTEDDMRAQMIDAVRAYPGRSWTKLRALRDQDDNKLIRGTETTLGNIRDQLLEQGVFVNTATVKGHYKLYLADDPETRSDGRTDAERIPFDNAASETVEPVRSPFAPIANEANERTTDEPRTQQDPFGHPERNGDIDWISATPSEELDRT